jgi:hypothetical protein
MPRPELEARTIPPLNATQLELALLGAVDILMLLDSNRVVQKVHLGPGLELPELSSWVGKDFSHLVCKASQTKLGDIFAHGQGTTGHPARWRHLNFHAHAGSLPLLVKYFGFDGSGGGRHLIIGRDLRPTVALQAKVQKVLMDMEQATEDQRASAPLELRLFDATESVGQRPLNQIVAETARTLERLCIEEAMRRTNGNTTAAAELLGLAQSEFDLRRGLA